MSTINSKLKLKSFSSTGEIPTTNPSTNPKDGTWDEFSVFPTEISKNTADNKVFMGTECINPLIIESGNTTTVKPSFGTNTNTDTWSSVLGGTANHLTASGGYNSIAGGIYNKIQNTVSKSFIGSGQYNYIQGSSTRSAILGGYSNTLNNSNYSMIGGGESNSLIGTGGRNVIGGGYSNTINSTSGTAVIAGGWGNVVSSSFSSIGGGQNNETSTFANVHILGSNITATKANTTYVEELYVKTGGIMNDDNGTVLRKKVFALPTWNMDTVATVNIAHSLSATEWKTVVDTSAMIIDDSATVIKDIAQGFSSAGGNVTVTSTNVTVNRIVSGNFDNTLYDSTAASRGTVVITYTPD